MTRYGSESFKCYWPRYWLHCALFVFCFYENPWKPSNPKLRQFRPLDVALTSFFFLAGKVLPKKPNLTCHIINNVHKEGAEKDGTNGHNKSQLFALYSVVENFAFTPFLYFLVVPEASLKDGVLKFIVSCA